MSEKKNVFDVLNSIDCSEHIEKKNGLSYLSWSWAWQIVKTNYPDARYNVREWGDKPYLYDEELGYMVATAVTINGECICMRLPVMDSSNKAQKAKPYTYVVRGKNGQSYEKTVEAATMFDINTAIMRCLVKNLAMFGLGLYIYAGEDIPEAVKEERLEQQKVIIQDRIRGAVAEMMNCKTVDEVVALWNKYSDLHSNVDFKNACSQRGNELKNNENIA